MILAVDVGYAETTALVAGILFKNWDSTTYERSVTVTVEEIAPYESGCFYKRELPCILKLLETLDEEIHCIVIDGYVTLGTKRDGLGMKLWHSLAKKIPIIGVAKTCFKETPPAAELLRGKSLTPLYISAVGLELADAKSKIMQMKGDFRLPTLLKWTDQLSRGIPVCQAKS